MEWYFYIVIGAAVAVLAAAVPLIRAAILEKRGRLLHSRVTAKLKNYARLRRYHVLTDVSLPCKGGEKTASHVLVGIFGVIIVDAYSLSGELYGTADDKKWTYVRKGGRRGQIASPVLGLQEKADALRTLLAASSFYRIAIDSVNVVQSSSKKLALYVPENLPVIRLGRLGAFLNKTKYDKDLGLDIDKIAGLLTKGTAQK